MDAKTRASFINSVVSNQEIACWSCGKPNEPDAVFCEHCGFPMEMAGMMQNEVQEDVTEVLPEPVEPTTNKGAAFASLVSDQIKKLAPVVEAAENQFKKTATAVVGVVEEKVKSTGAAFASVEKTSESNPAFAPIDTVSGSSPSFVSAEVMPVRKKMPAFVSAAPEKKVSTAAAFVPVEMKPTYTEPESVFAEGLPAWSIEPPQAPVRRKSKK